MDTREEVQTVELNQLRCFRLVAEMENISRAAKLLHISQPSLSQTIRRLEQEIGFPLFHREGKRIESNRAGQFLLEAARQVEDILERTKTAIEEENGRCHPVVSIYVGCASMLIPQLLRYLKGRNPGVQYIIRQWEQDSLSFAAEETADVRITSGALGEQEKGTPLLTEHICLALPAEHPLAAQETLYLHELDGEEFISLNRNWTLTRIIERETERCGFRPQVTMWVDNPNLMRELLRGRMGIAFIPDVSWRAFASQEIVIRQVTDCPMERYIYLSAGQGVPITREQRECMEGIREFFREQDTERK